MPVSYLSRTPTVAGNRQTWTWSAWVKRGSISSTASQNLFSTYSGSTNGFAGIRFEINDVLSVFDWTGSALVWNLTTAQVFRDPSSWYHVVVSVDTTQATAANRVRLYVNGLQVTGFTTANYPAQNLNTFTNTMQPAALGCTQTTITTEFLDAYLAEVYFIDGLALPASSFGLTDPTTGVWCPLDYSGATFGTNGFYLPFTNNSGLNTLGLDQSGRGNNWALYGATNYNQSTDVPTNTSATRANFATLNPLNTIYSGKSLSDGNLVVTGTLMNQVGAHATFSVTSGAWYAEVTSLYNAGGLPLVGVNNGTSILSGQGVAYRSDGARVLNGVSTAGYGATWGAGDTLGMALDLNTNGGQITFYKNGVSQGVAYTGLIASIGPNFYFTCQNNATGTTTFQYNFGQFPFLYAPPTGFLSLNTFNR